MENGEIHADNVFKHSAVSYYMLMILSCKTCQAIDTSPGCRYNTQQLMLSVQLYVEHVITSKFSNRNIKQFVWVCPQLLLLIRH